MKKTAIRFARDPSLDHIEVVIRAPERNAAVEALIQRITDRAQETLTVFDGYGNVRTVPPDQVITITVEGRLLCLATAEGSWFARQTLQSLEAALSKRRFVRISRYELVNLDHVRRFDFTVAGTLRLELANGTETWASRRCIPAIRRRLMGKE